MPGSLENPAELEASDEADECVNWQGVQRLAAAVLIRAILDIRCTAGRNRDDAARWIENPNDGEFSFVACCRALNRDPDQVRRILLLQVLPDWLANLERAALISPKPPGPNFLYRPATGEAAVKRSKGAVLRGRRAEDGGQL